MSERVNDYFAKEAGEYLDQLERLLDLPGVPDADQLLRLATGVRGSAQMAQAETVAGVAERLEDAARAVLARDVAWSEDLRSLAGRTVADLKLLVRALNRWGPEEEERVRIAIARWDSEEAEPLPILAASGGRPPTPGRVDEPSRTLPSGEEGPAVPVSSLFFDDAGPHVLTPGASPATATGAGVVDGPGLAAERGEGQEAAEGGGTVPPAEHAAPADAARDRPPAADEPSDREVAARRHADGPVRAGDEVVPVQDLLLRGESALIEAIALRPTFERYARGDAVPDRSLADLVQELFDLVEQAVTTDRPEV